jgi:carbamate kinase
VTTVIALGGIALIGAGSAEQRANLREACAAMLPLLREGRVAVTHGNGRL